MIYHISKSTLADFTSVDKALRSSQLHDGDELWISTGCYHRQDIKIGAQCPNITIRGCGASPEDVVFNRIEIMDTTDARITIANMRLASTRTFAVLNVQRIASSTRIRFEDVYVYETKEANPCALIGCSGRIELVRCRLGSATKNGIYMTNSRDVWITRSEVFDTKWAGILLCSSSTAQIRYSYIHHCQPYGIWVHRHCSGEIESNYFADNSKPDMIESDSIDYVPQFNFIDSPLIKSDMKNDMNKLLEQPLKRK
eukprot:gb/GECH01002246.1/.p1 GENE.gb/GECH01002246.1/~~gb/GECH01002246.1/.p1  ORF type:complete len:255 (+),score=33.85 gb/GECH01002246.1/:1-765(+)